MPVYDYKCTQHGVFYGLQTVDQHDQPKICPQCGVMCARIIRVAPQLLIMDGAKKQAMVRNDQARFEPLVSGADQRHRDHQHRQQCGCGKQKNDTKLFYTAKGEKMFPSMRPWMISH